MGAVEDQAGQRHAFGREPVDEERGLPQRVRFGGRHHDELGAPPLEQLVGAVGLLPEPAERRVQRLDERRGVGEHLRAQDRRHALHRQPDRPGDQSPDAAAGGQQQPPQPAVHEAAQSFRRVQEVQRVARRRGVHHDQVPFVFCREAVPASPWPCTPACPPATWPPSDRTGCPGSASARSAPEYWTTISSNVRRMSSIIACSSPDTSGASGTRWGVLPEILDAQRLRQSLGRVDRQHDDGAAVLGGAQRHRRRGRGLSDAARAAADDHAVGGVVQHRGHVQGRRGGAHRWAPFIALPAGRALRPVRRGCPGRRRRAVAAVRVGARRSRRVARRSRPGPRCASHAGSSR